MTREPHVPPMQRKLKEVPIPGVGTLCLHLLRVFVMAVPVLFIVGIVSIAIGIFGGFAVPVSVFVAMLGVVLIASSARRLRAERSSRLLNYLRIATRLNLPLPEFLDSLRRGEGYGMAKRAGDMSKTLRLGGGLGYALFKHVPEIPAHQTAVIWRGESAGRLYESLEHVAERAKDVTRDAVTARNAIVLQYTLIVLIALAGLLGVVGVFVLPTYVEIFEDFESEIPELTLLTFDLAQALGPVAALIAAATLLWVAGWSAYTTFIGGETVTGPLRRLLEPILWRMPVVANAYRSRAWSDACFGIEQAMRAGLPLPEAVDSARHPVQSGVVNRRLNRFTQRLRSGREMPDAARDARLPRLVAGMLGTASAASQPADVFAFLSRYYSYKTSAAEVMVRAAVLPATTLFAAALVGWFVFSIFYPLVVLIEASIKVAGYA